MQFEVKLSNAAIQDLFDIYYYVATHDSFEKADNLRNELYKKCFSLTVYPFRGILFKEIPEFGTDIYRLIIKPYSIFYTINDKNVNVLAVLDDRRDLNSLLEERFDLMN